VSVEPYPALTYIITFSLLGSVGALTGAGAILAFPRLHDRLKTPLLSYAVGTLLGATFLGLIPSAIEQSSVHRALATLLAGFVGFFILEKVIRIPHSHAHTAGEEHIGEHLRHVQPAAPLMLIGDAFHNFVDGILIATTFGVSVELGILTALAVVAHEIPQEIGDFVILLESGMSRMKAYWLNFLSALATVLGALLTYWFRPLIEPLTPAFLSLAASSFLYIATVDLAPVLHHHTGVRNGIRQTLGLLMGIGTIFIFHRLLG
jgi:zinc and cadmium transporter